MCGVFMFGNDYWSKQSLDFMKKPLSFPPITPGFGGGCDHTPKNLETPLENGHMFIEDKSHLTGMEGLSYFWQPEKVPTPSKSEAEGSEEAYFRISIKYPLPGYGGGYDNTPKNLETPLENGDMFIEEKSHLTKIQWLPSFWQLKKVPTPSKSEAEGSEEAYFGIRPNAAPPFLTPHF